MNWNKHKLLFLGLLGLSSTLIHAQDSLNLMNVVARTLKSNYQIQVSEIQSKQASNLANLGQAGFFPQINANGSGAFSQNNTNLQFAGGLPDVERKGAVNTSIGANIGLNYTVFNGFGRVYTYRNLVGQSMLTQLQAKVVAENLVFEAVSRFVNYQQFRLNAQLAEANLAVSKQRLAYVEAGNKTGARTQLDVLSAQVDLNNDSLVWIQALAAAEKEGYALNVLMGEVPNKELKLSLDMPTPVLESEDALIQKVGSNGSAVILAQLSRDLSRNQLDLTRSRQMPTLNINANYGFLNSQNGAGIILSQSNTGFNSSAALVVPIFNGKQLNNAVKNADLEVQRRGYEYEQAKLQAMQMIYEAMADQKVLETQINTLSQSVVLAESALKRAQEAYANGQIQFNDLRASQVRKLQAESALVSARMNLLRLRYSIKRLCGELLN